MQFRLLALLGCVIVMLLGVRAIYQSGYEASDREHEAAAAREALRRLEAQAPIVAQARRRADRDRAAAARVDALAAGVRAALTCDGSASAPAPAGSAPASTDPGVPADVPGEVEARLRTLAAEADRTRSAGAACERIADSLNEGR